MLESGRQRLFTVDFSLTCAASFLSWTVNNLLLATLPIYVLALGGKDNHLGYVVAAYNLSLFVSRPLAGKWSERLGPALLLRVGAGMLFVSIFAYLLVGDPWWAIAVRAAHGVGMGIYTTSATTIASYAAPANRRGEALGIFSTALALTLAIGPALGMLIVDAYSYQTLFVVIWLMTTASALMAYRVDRGGRYGQAGGRTGKLFNTDALLPSLVGFAVYFSYGGLSSYLPVYALERGLANPGLFFTAYAVGAISIRIVGGKLSDAFGRSRVIIPAIVLMGFSLLVLSAAADAWSVVTAGWLFGLGSGVLYPTLMALAVDRSSPQERGSAMATLLGTLELGITFGAIFGSLVVARAPLPVIWLASSFLAFLGLLLYVYQSARERRVGLT
ncbi:MAG: MFS transporter [Chloroflexi bacterium]|nr:MFS transporter [Chloroflexota bacterium]